jgi:YHS domain-containing protein
VQNENLKTMKHILTIAILFLTTYVAQSQSPAYCNQDGVAIKGYDVVAYFKDNAASKGLKKFSHEWKGIVWRFKSQSNLDAFKENPEKYAPQFGGYCAFGVSEDHKSPTDPKAFTIVNDKLYLNYNPEVKKLWLKDTVERIKTAEKFWVTLKDKE